MNPRGGERSVDSNQSFVIRLLFIVPLVWCYAGVVCVIKRLLKSSLCVKSGRSFCYSWLLNGTTETVYIPAFQTAEAGQHKVNSLLKMLPDS